MTELEVGTLLVDLTLILAMAWLAGRVAQVLGQPAVIGEIVAGILVGPTLFHGAIANSLMPVNIRPQLSALADIGLVLFMFVVGLEFDYGRLRGSGRLAGATAAGAALPPFVLGCIVAGYLARKHHPADKLTFVLFIGVALSITAFPVLARILTDRGIAGTLVGTIALSAAALCDLTAWTMLAGVQAIAGSGTHNHWLIALVIPLVVVLFGVVRPAVRWLLTRDSGTPSASNSRLIIVLACLLASAALTQLVGLHLVFGAFLFGLAMPRQGTEVARAELLDRVEASAMLLLPVYFVISGLNVDLSRTGATGIVELCLITATAIVGKFAGTFAAARTQGLCARKSAVLATLMNTRGLTELIALSVGLQIGILDHSLYSLMVVTTLVTTAMAGPLLRLLAGREGRDTFLLERDHSLLETSERVCRHESLGGGRSTPAAQHRSLPPHADVR